MKVEEIKLYLLRIPFRSSFRHARASRSESKNLMVIVKMDNGVRGFGESIPREYVTGETEETAFTFLEKETPKVLPQISFDHKDTFLGSLADVLEDFPPASRCALEIACLDAFSRTQNVSLCDLFRKERPPAQREYRYSAVMSAESLSRTWKLALLFRLLGFKEIKIKMGFDNDLARLKIVRFLSGPRVDLRLDINGAWEAGEAIEKIKAMKPYRLSMVEQPVAANDLIGFKKVTEESGVETMADESVRSLSEAETLAKERICHSLNIRLSKCGGFLNSLKMADLVIQYGLSYQIGCHVGETGILSAAGWHLACCLPEARYLEGSYSRFLLKEDVIRENLTFGWGGRPRGLKGAGLGIEVLEEKINKYSYKSLIVRN